MCSSLTVFIDHNTVFFSFVICAPFILFIATLFYFILYRNKQSLTVKTRTEVLYLDNSLNHLTMRWLSNILIRIYSTDLQLEMIGWKSVLFQYNTKTTLPELHHPRSLQYREQPRKLTLHHQRCESCCDIGIGMWTTRHGSEQAFHYRVMTCGYLLNVKSENPWYINFHKLGPDQVQWSGTYVGK